jgi:hypothetical protein
MPPQHTGVAVRASDAEREQTVAQLQRNFADGRLTWAELEERAGAAYAAQTRTSCALSSPSAARCCRGDAGDLPLWPHHLAVRIGSQHPCGDVGHEGEDLLPVAPDAAAAGEPWSEWDGVSWR